MLVSESSPSRPAPKASPSPLVAASPNQLVLGVPPKQKNRTYHLTIIPGIGIAVTVAAVMMLIVLVVLIRRKKRELEDSESMDMNSSKFFSSPWPMRKFQEGLFDITYSPLIMISFEHHFPKGSCVI